MQQVFSSGLQSPPVESQATTEALLLSSERSYATEMQQVFSVQGLENSGILKFTQ